MNNKISNATMQRYPAYLKALRKFKNDGILRIKSSDLSTSTNILPTTIRRDFSMLGKMGKQGYGYDVESLIQIFSEELGVQLDEKIILVGCGNLGKAMLNYNKWDNVVGEIVCGFDKFPENVTGMNIPVFNIDDVVDKLPEGCRIAILTITNDIQKTVDKLSEAGITGIVDFTIEHFEVPENMSVRTIDIVSKVQELVFEASRMRG